MDVMLAGIKTTTAKSKMFVCCAQQKLVDEYIISWPPFGVVRRTKSATGES